MIISNKLTDQIHFIDPRIEHVGVSKLRQLDGKTLKENVENKSLVIRDHEVPLAVLLSYEQYLLIQNQMQSLVETIEIFTNAEEFQLLAASLGEVASDAPRKSLEEVRASLKRQK